MYVQQTAQSSAYKSLIVNDIGVGKNVEMTPPKERRNPQIYTNKQF
jgi:hypothetical protein